MVYRPQIELKKRQNAHVSIEYAEILNKTCSFASAILKKSLLENFGEEKIIQSILRPETLINYNEKRIEKSSEGKYTTLTFKALKIRWFNI